MKIRNNLTLPMNAKFRLDSTGLLRFGDRVCVPSDQKLRDRLLTEAHSSLYAIHPGVVKMYHDLKSQFWWGGMKADVVNHVRKCLTCQRVKIEHRGPATS